MPENENETPGGFQIPENLADLNPEELQAALDAALQEAAGIRETEPVDMTDEQIDRLTALADFVDSVGTENQAREVAAQERADRAAAVAARLDGGDGGDGENGEDSDDGAADGEDGAADTDGAEGAEAPQAVAASAGRPGRRQPPMARGRAPKNPRPAAASGTGRYSLIAAADAGRNTPGGRELDSMGAAVDLFIERLQSFPQSRRDNTQIKLGVASVHRNPIDGLDARNIGQDFNGLDSLLKHARDERRLPGGSLIAAAEANASRGLTAAGWCSPSETLYDLCQQETLAGIIDVAEINVSRGGIRFTPGPDFSTIFANAGFFQTEAQAIAGEEKPCFEVDCPDFGEIRLDAVGLCVRAGLLTRTAYPELIRRWVEGSFVANEHKVAGRVIERMRTLLGGAINGVTSLAGTPVSWSTLTSIEFIIESERQKHRLSDTETMEVVVPRWLRVAVRADLANRIGIGAESVTDAQIRQHFADRGAVVQWVLNYQELTTTQMNALTFPDTVEIMVYPAGTFVKGTADVISLDAVYDTVGLQSNSYTAAFVEDGLLVAKLCHGGRRVTLPVNVTGMLGAALLVDNWGTPQTPAVPPAAYVEPAEAP